MTVPHWCPAASSRTSRGPPPLLLAAFTIAAAFAPLPATTALLTPEQCCASGADSGVARASASATLDAMEQSLLGSGRFARAVRGSLNVQVATAAGGGTNPYGDYFTYEFPTDLLPPDACDLLVPPQTNPTGSTTICRRDWWSDPGNYSNFVTLSYLLGPADAIVVHLCTPPPTAYFSMDAYISSRFDDGAFEFSPGTNFGDTINQCTVRLPSSALQRNRGRGGEGNTNGTTSPFDQPAAIIQSADGAALRAVAAALAGEDVGMDPERISSHELDSSVIRLYDRSGGAAWAASKPDTL